MSNNPNNAFVNYNWRNAPEPSDMGVYPARFTNMQALRQSLSDQDLESISHLKQSNAIQESDINFNNIPESDFKTELKALFHKGGRRRKTRRHRRKTRKTRATRARRR